MLGFGCVLQIKKTCQSFLVLGGSVERAGAGWILCGDPALASGFPYLGPNLQPTRLPLMLYSDNGVFIPEHLILGNILLYLLTQVPP